MKKLIRYRIPISMVFPATHPRKGEFTHFAEEIAKKNKIHTIRANYDLWEKRFEKINKGQAVLELYYWIGKPYNSKTIVICQLGLNDGIGIQKIEFEEMLMCESLYCFSRLEGNHHKVYKPRIGDKTHIPVVEIANNDGLSLKDFKDWFKKYDLSKPLAVIHFTDFRY